MSYTTNNESGGEDTSVKKRSTFSLSSLEDVKMGKEYFNDCITIKKDRNIIFYNIVIGVLLILATITISTGLANSYYIKKENEKEDCPDVNDWLSWVTFSIGVIASIVLVVFMFISCKHYLHKCCPKG
jgi:uncharacterized protein involved in cysteine biosynthesis